MRHFFLQPKDDVRFGATRADLLAEVTMTLQTPLFRQQTFNFGLVLMFSFSFLTIIGSSLGLLFDPRLTEILGTPTWVKTFKFAVSMLLYGGSLIWLVGLTKDRIAFWAGQLIGVLMSLELVLIIVQGFRAQPMHYNISGGFDTLLWDIMAVTVQVVMLTFIVLIVRVWQKLRQAPVVTWAIRLGLVLTIVGFFQGGLMTQGTPEQINAKIGGKSLALLGAHTVGNPSLTPDVGVGLPLVGWNTQHGDLRIGHFVGTHALQVIPLLGLWLSRRRFSHKAKMQLLSIGFLGYAGLFVLTTWQAWRGQALLQPDGLTLVVLSALLLAVLGSSWLVQKLDATRVR
jgi:uncharacterized membrane protein